MIKVTTYTKEQIADERLQFAVIAARYRGQWLFCRHKRRTTWEIPGGHREAGESIDACARRELYEETGVDACTLRAVRVYSAEDAHGIGYGMLYFAEVETLGQLPADFEIGEVRLFDTLPQALTYPEIQGYLYEWIQAWLNLQSSAGELWDVYDSERRLTGRTHRRGDPMPHGDYHLCVHVWIRTSRGEYLLTKRAPNKGFPNMWECTGGSALAGDDSLQAALREVREETGLALQPACGECLLQLAREDNFTDVWLFRCDVTPSQVQLQPGETCDVMLATEQQLLDLQAAGKLVPLFYLQEFLEKVRELS